MTRPAAAIASAIARTLTSSACSQAAAVISRNASAGAAAAQFTSTSSRPVRRTVSSTIQAGPSALARSTVTAKAASPQAFGHRLGAGGIEIRHRHDLSRAPPAAGTPQRPGRGRRRSPGLPSAQPKRPLIASTMRSALGMTARSRRSLNGIGTSSAPTRATGASQPVERRLGHGRGDLAAEAAELPALVHHHEAVGALDRFDDRGEVERPQRARIDHLDADALALEPGRRRAAPAAPSPGSRPP